MSWKETVLSEDEIAEAVVNAMYEDGETFPPLKEQYATLHEDKAIAKAQAKKSYKAGLFFGHNAGWDLGYKQGRDSITQRHTEGYKQGKRELLEALKAKAEYYGDTIMPNGEVRNGWLVFIEELE